MPPTQKSRSERDLQAKYGLELAHHKAKIKAQKAEITKLKQSIQALKAEAQ
jgi:hypothetical protein